MSHSGEVDIRNTPLGLDAEKRNLISPIATPLINPQFPICRFLPLLFLTLTSALSISKRRKKTDRNSSVLLHLPGPKKALDC